MTTTPFIRRTLRAMARIPFSVSLAGVVMLAGVLAGTAVTGGRHSGVASAWGVSLQSTVFGGNWISIWAALLIPRGPPGLVAAVLGIVLLLGLAERLLGSVRTAVAWVTLSTIGITVGLGLQAWGRTFGEVWTEFSARHLTLAPLIGVAGPLLLSSAVAPALWRRRIRLWSLATLGTVLLYVGDAAALYASIAALFGLFAGVLLPDRHRHAFRTPSSARETRRLFGTLLALTAIGPLLGLIRHAKDSPLSPIVFLIERQNVILLLLVAILVCSVGLSRGTRWGYLGALTINLGIASLAVARVDFTLLLSDTDAPNSAIETFTWNIVLIVLPLLFILALIIFRRLILAEPVNREVSAADRARARALLEQHGGTLSYLTMWAGNRYWFRADGRGYVAYRVHQAVALTCGDPVCPPELLADTVREFAKFCDHTHLMPAFYSASSQLLPFMDEAGWARMSVGEETLLHTSGLDFSGSAWANVRNGLRRGERDGLRAVWTRWADLTLAQRLKIVAISEEWIAEKSLPEMGFTLGSLRELNDPNVQLMLVTDANDDIHAVTSWLPSYQDGIVVAWTNDFMRRAMQSSGRVMEFVIAKTALHCAASGIELLSLSGAPLAAKPSGLPSDATQPESLRRFGEMLSTTLEPAYGFASLFAFKSKFNPEYRTLWLFVPDPLALPAVGIAIARAYLPEIRARDALRLTRRRS